MVNFSLTGKNILIIGSSSGLGETLAKYLYKTNVDIMGISRTKSQNIFKQLQIDISKKEDLKNFKIYLESNKIKFDGVILNAGISSEPKLKQKDMYKLQSTEEFLKILEVNLIGIYSIMKIIEPFLNNGSSIVGISSIGSELGFPNNPSYQASKAGLNAMIRSLAVDLSPKKIRANHLNLGYFKAPMTKLSYKDEDLRLQRAQRTILGRWGELEEFLGPVIFLLSDASSYITGSGINVDGGWSIKGL